MPNPISILNRAYHRSLDLALRVDRRSALNSEREGGEAGPNIAGELFAAVREMKADAYDPSCACFDYAVLPTRESYSRYRDCSARLRAFDPTSLRTRGERLAFWINLYNALVIDAVVAFGIRASVREDGGFFRRAAYIIGGRRYSADDIEHGILRGNRPHFHPAIWLPQFAPDDPRLALSVRPPDPRVHCALVCASQSCPPIAAYEAARVDDQLDLACAAFVNGGVRLEGGRSAPSGRRVCLSPIFRWYRRDFGGREGVREFLLRYLDAGEAREALENGSPSGSVGFYPYDWSLNAI
ncbi:MAG: DUF547 domain-containing protein [Dehalococcoidia bacterium]